MAKINFVNPNEPEQPASGVYRWYYVRDGKEFTLYIGNAGKKNNRESSPRAPSTLLRGIQEAARGSLSSDMGGNLDTDFVVGTAVRFFRSNGFDCYWVHLSDDPTEEKKFCHQYDAVLQDGNGKIKRDFKPSNPDGGQWKGANASHIRIAEQLLHQAFAKLLL